jgi:hypothetical protein
LGKDTDLEDEHPKLAALVADEICRTFDAWSMARNIFESNMDTVMILMDNEAKKQPSNVWLERAREAREKKPEQRKNAFQRAALRLMHCRSLADPQSGTGPDPVSMTCLDGAVLEAHVNYSVDECIQVSFTRELNQLMSLPQQT